MAQPLPANDTEPILPPAEEAGLLALVRDALNEPTVARLLGPRGETVELPRSVHDVLMRVVRELAQGNAIAVVPVHAELTTQQARNTERRAALDEMSAVPKG